MQAENELRQKLMSNFVKDNRNKLGDIADAIGSGNIKLAHRLAHTLKGNAGQLGKTFLQKAAEDIERQLKDRLSAGHEKRGGKNAQLSSGRNPVTEEYLKALEVELNAVLTEFTSLINDTVQPRAGNQSGPFDLESARDLLKKLETMLEMGNPECRDLIDNLRLIPGLHIEQQGDGAPLTRASVMRGLQMVVEDIIQQMNDLDFELALVSLAELKKKLGMV